MTQTISFVHSKQQVRIVASHTHQHERNDSTPSPSLDPQAFVLTALVCVGLAAGSLAVLVLCWA